MNLIEAGKVKQVIKDYWKAQVDKALTLTFINGNEANKRINSYLEHNHELLKAIDELPPAEPDTTTCDSIPAETGKNDGDKTNGDCISRQAAINIVKSRKTAEQCEKGVVRNWAVDLCVDALEKLPSAQPELDIGNDGTLYISVSKGQLDKINRVLVEEDGSIFCKQFY